MILIIDNYDSFTYNIVQSLYEIGYDSKVFRNDEITISEIEALNPSHLIISPGPKTPSEAGISKAAIEYFAGKIPVLGICLGHQAMAEVFGGKVIHAKELVHGKANQIFHDAKTIFSGVESPMQGGRYHSLAVEKESLPDCLEISAETEDGEIMAMRHKKFNVEGIQFHPESILTPLGKNLLKNFIEQPILVTFEKIMSGELPEEEIKFFLIATKDATVSQLTGFVKIMREKSEKIELTGYEVVDTCGTGGDCSSTFNISTASAIVAASCGVKVAKHGNRAASSNSGSADLLQALGYDIEASKEKVRDDIINKNFGFMFAPKYHSSMKHVAAARKSLGKRTIFNILGPLANPANADYQLLGVYDASLTEKMAQVLGNIGIKRAFVLAAEDGLDEISLMSKTKITEYWNGKIKTFLFDPRDYGFNFCKLEDVQVKDIEESKIAVLDVLNGKKGPKRDIVVLNTAFILLLSGKINTIQGAIDLANKAIDSGRSLNQLRSLL